MLRQLDSTVWVNEVSFKLFGVDFGNRMTCIKLKDDSLWLHSTTKFDESTYEKIKVKGTIKFLIAPSKMHNLFVMDWKDKALTSQVLAPAQAKKLQADIKLDEIPEQEISQLFNNEINCIAINGIPTIQEFAFFHKSSKTLILTDIVFNFGKDVSGWQKLFLKLYGAYDKFGPTFTIRALIKDKKAFSESIKKVAFQDFDRIIMSHGHVIEKNAKRVFNEAFKTYLES